MKPTIIDYLKAGYPGLYILSPEEVRVEAHLKGIANELEFGLYAWSLTEGLVDTSDGQGTDVPDPVTLLSRIEELPDNTLIAIRDLHLFFDAPDPVLVRGLKDTLRHAKARGKVLILIGCRHVVPPELAREIVLHEFALPTRTDLLQIADAICESSGVEQPHEEIRDQLADAASGLTSIEAENAFALSIVIQRSLDPAQVARQKAREIAKGGLLEIVETPASLDEIGGLNNLKEWLIQRRLAFSHEARDYGLPYPKGLLITGIPGTGKSMMAKATAGAFGRTLLRLDTGRLYGGLVGQSEANLRSVIQTCEAIAPCVLWIDEIEKAFAGSQSSGRTDGGTSARLFGDLLSWMQEKEHPVFVVATANDVTQLPPELLRKGRFDELFYVDLPSPKERESIWEIQVEKHGRNPEAFDLSRLSRHTSGWTGSEIEQAFIEGLFEAFNQNDEPSDEPLQKVTNQLAKEQWESKFRRPVGAIEQALSGIAVLGRATLNLLDHEKRRRGRVQVHDVIKHICTTFRPFFEGRSIKLNLQLCAGKSPYFQGSEAAVESIITNLINNSIVELEESNAINREICLETEVAEGVVRILVSDSGRGLADIRAKDVWLPGQTTRRNGTGLGLTIVRDTVLDLGGEVGLNEESLLGGLQVEVEIPIIGS